MYGMSLNISKKVEQGAGSGPLSPVIAALREEIALRKEAALREEKDSQDSLLSLDEGAHFRYAMPQEIGAIFRSIDKSLKVDAAGTAVRSVAFRQTYSDTADKFGRSYGPYNASIVLVDKDGDYAGLCSFNVDTRGLAKNKAFVDKLSESSDGVEGKAIIEFGHLWGANNALLGEVTCNGMSIKGYYQWFAMHARLNLLNGVTALLKTFTKQETNLVVTTFIDPENSKSEQIVKNYVDCGAVDLGNIVVANKYKGADGSDVVNRRALVITDPLEFRQKVSEHLKERGF